MKEEYAALLEKSRERQPVIKRQLNFLSKHIHKNFDHVVADYHDEVFAEINCLDCGNCCKHLGPRLGPSDVKRLCKVIGHNEKLFYDLHLREDEDEDLVFKKMPCMFLEADNTCNVYKDRPRACADFPHTQERNIQRKLPRLAVNTLYCPGAYLIAEKIIERYSKDTGE